MIFARWIPIGSTSGWEMALRVGRGVLQRALGWVCVSILVQVGGSLVGNTEWTPRKAKKLV